MNMILNFWVIIFDTFYKNEPGDSWSRVRPPLHPCMLNNGQNVVRLEALENQICQKNKHLQGSHRQFTICGKLAVC
jgi:hypothetical protein